MFQFRIIPLVLMLLLPVSCGNPVTEAQYAPADPTVLAVEQLTSSSARLSWTPSGDAASYYVFARLENDTYYTTPAAMLPAGRSSYAFTGLAPASIHLSWSRAVFSTLGFFKRR